jgi:hypothetical protein
MRSTVGDGDGDRDGGIEGASDPGTGGDDDSSTPTTCRSDGRNAAMPTPTIVPINAGTSTVRAIRRDITLLLPRNRGARCHIAPSDAQRRRNVAPRGAQQRVTGEHSSRDVAERAMPGPLGHSRSDASLRPERR